MGARDLPLILMDTSQVLNLLSHNGNSLELTVYSLSCLVISIAHFFIGLSIWGDISIYIATQKFFSFYITEFINFFCLFCICRAAPMVHGGSQARGPVGAVAIEQGSLTH